MSYQKLTDFSKETVALYDKFKKQSGSEQIAEPISIQVIFDICRQKKLERVLEMGGGLGTLSYTLLKYSSAFVDIYEVNDFCKKKLKENLSDFAGRYQILESYRLLPPAMEYDLLIIDGGNGKDWDKGFSSSIWFYLHYLKSVKIIYLDGKRHIQRLWARKALRQKYLYKLQRYSAVNSQGALVHRGLKIICQPHNFFLWRWLNFIFWEVMEWDTFKKAIDYRFNKVKKILKI